MNNKEKKREQEADSYPFYEEHIKKRREQMDEAFLTLNAAIDQTLEEISSNAAPDTLIRHLTPDFFHVRDGFCCNAVINAVLTEKQQTAQKESVRFHWYVQADNHCSIAPSHLCSIFSNLLDNALEAACSLPAELRFVKLRAKTLGNYLVIVVRNSFASDYLAKTKPTGRGYGTLILKEIAEEYSGYYQTEISENEYKASLALSLSAGIKHNPQAGTFKQTTTFDFDKTQHDYKNQLMAVRHLIHSNNLDSARQLLTEMKYKLKEANYKLIPTSACACAYPSPKYPLGSPGLISNRDFIW